MVRRAGRLTLVVGTVLVPLLLVAVVTMVVTWPGEPRQLARTINAVELEYPSGVVRNTAQEQCRGTVEDQRPDGTVPEKVRCLQATVEVTSGSEAGRTVKVWATATLTSREVRPGTRVVLERYPPTATDEEAWAWHDFQRTIPLGALLALFAVSIVLVAGMRGLRALGGLIVAFTVIGVYVLPALLAGENAVVVALAASTVIMTAVLYLAHGLSLRTSTALIGTLAGLALTTGLGAAGARWAHLSGVTTEDDYRLAQLLGDVGAVSLKSLFLAGLVLAGLGVLNDVTITQASAVWELRAASPSATRLDLFRGGMRIGRDHIASTVYTIAFAYTGASLPVLLLLLIYQLPLMASLTSGQFAAEIVRTAVSSVGLVLAIPLTTLIAVVIVTTAGASVPRHRGGGTEQGHAHAHSH